MSSGSRSTSRGGKGTKLEPSSTNKPQKADAKTESPKTLDHNPKTQPTAEQMRIAQIIDTRTEDPNLKDKIKQAMDATRKTEDEVCTALHDCDNDLDRAVNMLLEGMGQGEWETLVKKKKNRQPSTKSESTVNNQDLEQEEWAQEREVNPERERTRARGGGPPRMRGRGSLDNRRGRENKENEKNLEEGREGFRRGGGRMMNGPGRSGRGGRGGGRLGPRTFQNRDKGGFPRSIETWNNPGADENTGESLKMDKWGDDFPSPEDWDNEEYTGSLADSKVFTPSGGALEPITNSEPLVVESTNPDLSSSLTVQNLSSSVASSSSQMSQSLDLHQPPSQLSQPWLQSPVPVVVGPLTAVQSEYLSQLTQATENLKSAVGIGTSSSAAVSAVSYGTSSNSYPVTSSTAYQPPSPPSGFTSTSAASFSTSNFVGSANSYGNQMQDQTLESSSVTAQCPTQTLPSRPKTQRPRVPPPSKIPQSAVEMPGDAINSSIGYLDVQFGGLEFGSETSSFETSSEQSKYPSNVSGSVLDSLPSPRTTSNLDLSGTNQTSVLDTYSGTSSQKTNQPGIASALTQNQKLSGGDTMLSTSEHKVSQPSFSQNRSSNSAGLDMDKTEVGLSYSASNTATYQPSYQSQKSSGTGYQQTSSYTSSNYSSTQVTSSAAVYPTNQSQMSYASSGTVSSYSNQPTVPSSSYPSNSYSQASAGVAYQTGPTSYTSINQQSVNSFPSATPSYQATGQSVYGSSTLGGSVNYAGSTGTGQYQNNYGGSVATTSQNHTKLSSALNTGTKEAQYDTATTSSSNLSSTNVTTTNSGLSTNVNASPALGLASSSQTVNTTSTKVSSSTGKSGVVPNIPPGVPPMLGTQYIMSQGGLPYFQQPVYSYEDLQLLQQRIPHVATGYFDMGFQAPTSLATGREGGLASVAYSMSDGRFTRADNNASPVPSTLSQQSATQAHQQPMLNPTPLPPGYAYFYGGGMMPGSFQYGTPAIYPMPPATNTHGSTSTTQYPKPGSYGSGYGSGYDGLVQNQDYGKTGYVSNSQSQSKAGVGANAGTAGSSATDLSATMYGKSHVTLGKVNVSTYFRFAVKCVCMM
ncbi:protein lingerer isoform X2 [Zootermopsis nevadensis]|uniref:protein lingerer isoform X2 n=1 Tax=Zootermopsis nevadensis TaxID=136037 RepID=UPI000B8EAB71|nr:protein lingerer isoform X2 [Zootermopsis nevadensis]